MASANNQITKLLNRRVGEAVSTSSQASAMSPLSTRRRKAALACETIRAITKIRAATTRPGTAVAMEPANWRTTSSIHAVERSPQGRVQANWCSTKVTQVSTISSTSAQATAPINSREATRACSA